MSEHLPPLLLRPWYVPKPWGGRRMEELLGRTDLPAGPVGESWEAYDLTDAGHPAGCSVVDGGPHDGRSVREVLGAPLGLFLKVLDAAEDLSIQVHPDGRGDDAPDGPIDESAVKEEAWVALASAGSVAVAEPGRSFEADDVPTGHWLERLAVRPLRAGGSDAVPSVVHVPGGTVHAILAGALVLEIQNPVDLTWRVDDYGRVGLDGRPRALHVAEAAGQLRRPTPAPAPCLSGAEAPDGWQALLRGERFAIRIHAGGRTPPVPSGLAYLCAPGLVTTAEGEKLDVPAHRTVLLPSGAREIACDGQVIALASR